MIRRWLTIVVLTVGLCVGAAASAHASDAPSPPPKCFAANAQGELPTCTEVNGQWSVSYGQDFGGGGEGIPSGFIALAVLVFLIGGGLAVWRVSMARQMATNAGLNPGQATAVTLLGSPGLDAAYLAANLQQRSASPTAAGTPARTAEQRLGELQRLRDQGLVTAEEYDAQRKAIVGSV